ncbi:MAG: hypothetical protein A4E48_01752 [Methanosaeta sp. PtaU1.Bin060]|nr:MAG: hypothetical protein A4E48_01752 [Methanosaeta sp. PtaU1.Bin060]
MRYMPRYEQVPELLALKLSKSDMEWLRTRAEKLQLRPAIVGRMLLSQAIKIDRQEPGKLFAEAV